MINYEELAWLFHMTNDQERFSVDLDSARSSTSLSSDGTIGSGDGSGFGLALAKKGDATWTLIIVWASGRETSYPSTDLNTGDVWEGEFTDIKFTNTVQASSTDPVFYISRRV